MSNDTQYKGPYAVYEVESDEERPFDLNGHFVCICYHESQAEIVCKQFENQIGKPSHLKYRVEPYKLAPADLVLALRDVGKFAGMSLQEAFCEAAKYLDPEQLQDVCEEDIGLCLLDLDRENFKRWHDWALDPTDGTIPAIL